MRRLLAILILIMVFSIAVNVVNSATPSEIETAIQKGVAWLATQQDSSGAWSPSYLSIGVTGLVLLKFETHAIQHGQSPFDSAYTYQIQVQKGLDYLFSNVQTINIVPQTYGNPDSDGDGIGLWFPDSEPNYHTACALMAIAAGGAPDRVVNVAGSAVNGLTYRQVAVDMVDYLAFSQTDSGYGEGGWDYSHHSNSGDRSDNSIAGHVVLGLTFAETPLHSPPEIGGFGLNIPTFVRTELEKWVVYIQNTGGGSDDGGSGYAAPDSWVNVYKTGHLLQEMHFLGDTTATPRVQKAIDYMVRHWNDPDTDPGWKGSGTSNYLATLMIMKGLGVFGITTIDGIDWFDEIGDALVSQQNVDGSWPISDWDSTDRILSTTWALLTLQRAVPGAAPPSPRPSDPYHYVGGSVFSANKLAVLSPYLALISLVAVAAVVARKKLT